MAEDSGAILRHISSLKDMLDKVQNPRTSSDPYSSLLPLLLLGLELSDWGQCRRRAASISISWSPHGWIPYPGVLQASPTASYNRTRVSISTRRELQRNGLVEAGGTYWIGIYLRAESTDFCVSSAKLICWYVFQLLSVNFLRPLVVLVDATCYFVT